MSTTSCERCEDFAADALKVLSQRCAPDERHCSCVPHLRAEIDRLTAERTALLAPVEGVDLEEVLRLDREGTPAERWTVDTGEWREGDRYVRQVVVNQYEEVTKEYDFDDFPARSAELEAALAPIRTDEALITLYRTAAPALAREVIQLRAAVRFADEQGAEAIERVSRQIVADKWNSTADLQEEVKRLTAELEEARLTLAAEIGDIKGAPSTRWTTDGHNWYGARPDGGMDKIERWSNLTGDGTIKHCRGWTWVDRFGFEKDMGRFDLARAAMLSADASK